MSSSAAYVENLSDEALYKELRSHGIPAGPVVASTRSLYRRKLIQALENQGRHDDENVENDDRSFSHSSDDRPFSRSNDDRPFSHSNDDRSFSQSNTAKWSHFISSSPHLSYEDQDVSSRLNLSRSSPIYRHSVEESDPKPRYSYLGSQNSSRLSEDSSSYLYRKSPSSIRDEDSFSRMRKTFTETTYSRPEMSPRYRLAGSYEEHGSNIARHNREQSRSLRWIIFVALIVAAFLVIYVIYIAWSENDPYRQIEEEAKKLLEETDT